MRLIFLIVKYIDAHKGGDGRRGGPSSTPSKDFGKFGHKNAIKHENRGPPRFFHNPLKKI
jgi:hypothetical protein